MPVLGSIKYPGSTHYDIPDSFLLQSDVDQLVEFAKSFEFDTQISENAIDIITNSPGLNTNSFNIDGKENNASCFKEKSFPIVLTFSIYFYYYTYLLYI